MITTVTFVFLYERFLLHLGVGRVLEHVSLGVLLNNLIYVWRGYG